MQRSVLLYIKIILFLTIILFLITCTKEEGIIPTINIEKVNSGTDRNLYSVHFPSANTGYAGGTDGIVLKTNSGGDSWSVIRTDTTGFGHDVIAVYFTDNITGILVEDNYDTIVYKKYLTTDGGTTWTTGDSTLIDDIYEQYLSVYPHKGAFNYNSNLGFEVIDMEGENLAGSVYIVVDSMITDTVSTGVTYELYGVFFTDINNGYAVGNNSLIRTTDGGQTWEWLRSQLGADIGVTPDEYTRFYLRDLYCFDKDHGIAVGTEGVIINFYY